MKKQVKASKNDDAIVFLKGKKTTLRPILEKDIPLLIRWTNDPEIRQYMMTVFPVTENSEREWLVNLGKKSDKDIVLMIEVKGRPIGVMGVHNINWQNRTATTGTFIGEKILWGKGYGTDAKMTLLNYVFNTLGLRKVMSSVKSFNKRSLSYSLHCGYVREGCLRKQHFVDGKYWDEIVLGIFKDEWLPYWKKYSNGK